MGERRRDYANSSNHEIGKAIVPKDEPLDMELPSETMWSTQIGDNVASSSGSNLRSSFIGMGFLPSLVDKVIEENGEDDVDLLLETLFAYPALHKANSESSDSLDSLFSDKDESGTPQISAGIHLKEEPDVHVGIDEDKRASLLSMNFSVNEVNFAMDKLGEDAPVHEIVDFIIAAQMAENSENDLEEATHIDEETNTESLFGTMNTTLRLLEMGFSENQISSAIEKFGSEVPISELADSIFAGQIADSCVENRKFSSNPSNMNGTETRNDYRSFGRGVEGGLKRHSSDTFTVKKEEYGADDDYQPIDFGLGRDRKGKRPKPEYFDDLSTSIGPMWLESRKGGPKISSRQMPSHQVAEGLDKFGMPKVFKSSPCKSVDKMAAKPPYFFYGNVVNVSQNSWAKISQFLYGLEPEFVNTQFFSALSRKEGYMHNLPADNRFHIIPKSPLTIEDAIPQTKKWWPSWDTRKQLSCISTETSGISQLCDRLGKILISSHGLLSVEQQRDVLHQCRTMNLLWVGQYRLAPVEPEHLERIMGYPLHHTQSAEWSLVDRLQSFKNCFQTDTLGYHLSVLKSMFPGGLTVLSIFSGIGGAEVALHQLGIRLKGVVSVETNELTRKILKRWWQNTGQTGELVQMEDIQKLTTNKLESLINKFGGFDFIICQNPCTYTWKNSKIVADSDSLAGFDFSLFYEFVRVLQRVRSMMERKR